MPSRQFLGLVIFAATMTVACDIFSVFQPPLRPTPIPLVIKTLPPVPTETISPTETLPPLPTATNTVTPTLTSTPVRITQATTFPTEPNPIIPGALRVRFPVGGTSVNIEGNLKANMIDTYLLGASAGQTMTVNVTSPKVRMLLQVSGADGNPLKTFGAGFSDWSGVLPKTQDYYIGVTTENNSASAYTISISIPPPPSRTRAP